MFVEKSVFLDANATLDPVSSLTTKIEGQEFSSATVQVIECSIFEELLNQCFISSLKHYQPHAF